MTAEFARHGETHLRYGPRLREEFGEFQFETKDGARGGTLPVHWDGTIDDLPRGIDGVFERAFEQSDGNVLSAIGVYVPEVLRGRGLSRRALEQMLELARSKGFDTLIAPVKPTWKDRYPITPLERYAAWKRDDGLPFDPWMRTHARLGAEILTTEPHSVKVSGTVAEWESWTEMAFPESGEYVIPGGLAPLEINREQDTGLYWEPNVWMRHAVSV